MEVDKYPELEDDLVKEKMSEVEQILQDLANGVVDETLPRLTEDVAFDMDEVVVEDKEIVDDDEDDDTNEDEGDIGWIDEEERE